MATTRKKSETSSAKKTASKSLKPIRNDKRYGKQFAYILDCIEDPEHPRASAKKKIEYVVQCFEKYNYPSNKRIYPRLQDRIAGWLQGLPPSCVVAFSHYEIIKIGKKWGYCGSKAKEAAFVNNWFNVIACRIMQIYDYYHKPKTIDSLLR